MSRVAHAAFRGIVWKWAHKAKWLALSVGLGCAGVGRSVTFTPGGGIRQCEKEMCAELDAAALDRDDLALWTEMPSGTVLEDAFVTLRGTRTCQSGLPVVWIRVDGLLLASGPADVGGQRGVVLAFPSGTGRRILKSAATVDLDLRVGDGAHQCFRIAVTDENGAFVGGR